MLQPAQLDLRADRHVPFVRTLGFLDIDFTGATALKLEIRRYGDEPGTALISLAKVTTDIQGVRIAYAASDTVANHIIAARLTEVPAGYELTTPVFLSQLSIRIDKANVVALPSPQELGDDVDLVWDLHITPSGGDEDKYIGGAFILQAGATV